MQTEKETFLSDRLNPSLNVDEKIILVNEELNRLLAHFDSKADKAKTNFHFYKYTSIILAAITTIVSSLQAIYPAKFPMWILPIVSAGATIAVSFLGASNVQRIWINSRTTGQRLQAEKFLFKQEAERYSDVPIEKRLRMFSERMMEIWNEGHGKWEQTVNEGS